MGLSIKSCGNGARTACAVALVALPIVFAAPASAGRPDRPPRPPVDRTPPTSDPVSATTQASTDAVAPTMPTLLSAFDGGSSFCPEELWLRWTASSDNADAPTAIEYEVRVNGTINEVVPGATGTITYTEVLGANTVTIVAVDRAGNASVPSNAMTVFTNWAPGGCGI